MPYQLQVGCHNMHIAGTSFCHLEISFKKFQSHYDFSLALSKAINSNTIANLVMQVCLECVWYCDSFCDCGLKKVLLVEVDLILIYVWLKLWLKLRLNKK